MQNLVSQHDIDALIRADEAILLKHGAHCPISAHARDELTAFAAVHPDVTVAALEVTAHRDLAKYAAQRLGVEHQSPQVIIIRGGKVAWSAEHYAITAKDVGAQLKL
jgi:bacillithiol system protein YtxJ